MSDYPGASRGPTLPTHGMSSYRSVSTSSTSSVDEGGARKMKSPPPPTAKKPAIPPQRKYLVRSLTY